MPPPKPKKRLRKHIARLRHTHVIGESFTILELLIVMVVISVLALIAILGYNTVRQQTYLGRGQFELRTLALGVELYKEKYGVYPADVSRNVPPGIEEFIQAPDGVAWPNGAWPGSVLDYDNFISGGQEVIQITVRFCPIGGPLSACQFPKQPWAADFLVNSSVYRCIKGACKSHPNQPATYPGYCVNCASETGT